MAGRMDAGSDGDWLVFPIGTRPTCVGRVPPRAGSCRRRTRRRWGGSRRRRRLRKADPPYV